MLNFTRITVTCSGGFVITNHHELRVTTTENTPTEFTDRIRNRNPLERTASAECRIINAGHGIRDDNLLQGRTLMKSAFSYFLNGIRDIDIDKIWILAESPVSDKRDGIRNLKGAVFFLGGIAQNTRLVLIIQNTIHRLESTALAINNNFLKGLTSSEGTRANAVDARRNPNRFQFTTILEGMLSNLGQAVRKRNGRKINSFNGRKSC